MDIEFSSLETRHQVARLLACDEVLAMLGVGGAASFYERMLIPKKGARGGFRTVFKVTDSRLQGAQKEIAAAVARAYEPYECVSGFVPGRSACTGALPHLDQRILLHVDIRDFFGSIAEHRVRELFCELGAQEPASVALAQLCTLDGRLVQGSSASPVLANLACANLDLELLALAQRQACAYTRYADDITFSGEDVPELGDIEAALHAHGFSLCREKVRFQRRGRPQFVTGLCVADRLRPRVPYRVKRWLRQTLYFAERYGFENHFARSASCVRRTARALAAQPDKPPASVRERVMRREMARVSGWIAYVHGVEPELGLEMRERWDRIIEAMPKPRIRTPGRKSEPLDPVDVAGTAPGRR